VSDAVTPQALARYHAVRAGYQHPVVGPVSFEIRPGEVLGLTGANGTGKSTLLNAMTGVARIFSGSIERHPDLSISHHRQRPELPPELPLLGRELLGLFQVNLQMMPDLIAPLLDKPLSEFSGGQFQFLQACACLGSDADLVILDEPTNNLDGSAIAALSGMLTELGPHRSVLLVSHEQAFLRDQCSRMVDLTP